MSYTGSKWIVFFKDNPKSENEKTMVYLRRVFKRAKLISPLLKTERNLLDHYKKHYKKIDIVQVDHKRAAKI